MIDSSVKVKPRNNVIAGFGINNADYVVSRRKNGVTTRCPVYGAWFRLVNRACGDFKSVTHSCYDDVTVSEKWKYFMDFREWYLENVVEGWCLDKDLLSPYSREYGPDTCVFIPQELNLMIFVQRVISWNTLPGVTFVPVNKNNKFCFSYDNKAGKKAGKSLADEYEANLQYRLRKAEQFNKVVHTGGFSEQINKGILGHINLLLNPTKDSLYVKRRTTGKTLPTFSPQMEMI